MDSSRAFSRESWFFGRWKILAGRFVSPFHMRKVTENGTAICDGFERLFGFGWNTSINVYEVHGVVV